MKQKRKYTKRKPVALDSNPYHDYKFVIDSDWVPTKANGNNRYMEAIVFTAVGLESKESFAIPFLELKKLCGYANGHSAASSIRTALRKRIGKTKVGLYGTHVVKDHSGKEVAIRVRKK